MFRRQRGVDDFAAEIESHLQLEIDRFESEGLSPAEARAAALRSFGNVTRSREVFYEGRSRAWWDRLASDLRFALRMLRKSRAFTCVAVLTIAVGIASTTAMFSVVDATLLHPLPYPQPEQLVAIEDDLAGIGSYNVGLSQPEWLDLEHSGIFQHVSPEWFDENNLTGAAQPTRVRLTIVAPNFFAMLGVAPQLGRTFPPETSAPGFTGEVVISDGMWRRGFGADPRILDRSIRLDTDLYRIVAVMPAGFRPPGQTPDERNVDVWAATTFSGPPLLDRPPRNGRNIPGAIARLAPGLTVAAAQSRVDALVAVLRSQYPADYPAASNWTIRLVPLRDAIVGHAGQPLILLLAAVALVLLIGCVNVANLLLARASARGREFALRQALGAVRSRLARQLFTESLVLTVLGGAAALMMLVLGRRLLVQLVPADLPRLNDITISWSVLSVAFGVMLGCAMLFGLAPALQARSVDASEALKSDGRGLTGSREHMRTRRLLVVAEFALSLILIVAAGLLLRSFRDLLNAPLGFDPERVVSVRTRLPYPNDVSIDKYGTIAQEATFLREVMRRLKALPGVEEAAVLNTTAIPLDHAQQDANVMPLIIEGRTADVFQAPLVTGAVVVPEYFHLLRMTLVRGRLFTDADNETAPPVAVINEAMAQAFWPGANPIGEHVRLTRSAKTWATVVGVVADARTESLKDAGVPELYASAYQKPAKHLAILLRGPLDAAAFGDRVREEVQRVDDTLPVYDARPLTRTVSASLAQRRFSMEIVGLFAVTALLLAGLGIYGVAAFMVTERTREFAVRLALGADPSAIVRSVVGQGLALMAQGAAVGVVGAAVLSRVMTRVLYGVRPTDPITFAAGLVIVIAVGLCACYIPAQRITTIDPAVALRSE